MPQSTPNLSLVTYDLTLDSGVYFSVFRSTLAGYTNSALTKIDTWAGQVNADLATLKQSPSIIRVSATKDSDFVYSATVLNMTQYSLNQYINLSLSADNVGTVSLNINALGGKSLLKFNNAGTLVNISAKDLRQGKNNLFTYNGTAWVWVNAISSDQLNIAGTVGNLVKISADNTLEDSGATFSNSVTNNAIVQRTATGQIKGATASANDDVVNKLYADTIDNKIGLLSALETVDKASIVGAINENFGHIGNLSTLTTTEKTNLVGATNEINSAKANKLNSEFVGTMTLNGEVVETSKKTFFLGTATPTLTIDYQNNFKINNINYVDFGIRKTDNSDFLAGQQISAITFDTLTISVPKNLYFTIWKNLGNVLVGGGVGTLFVNKACYIIPQVNCNYIRIFGFFVE